MAIGVVAIVLPRVIERLPESPALAPIWVALALSLQLFVLVFPLWTRRQSPEGRFVMPNWRQWLREGTLALPLVIGGLVSLSLIQQLLVQIWPDASFTPNVSVRLAQSSLNWQTYIFFFGAVVWAPLAEEIFFRGFLFNAFRTRMPLPAAVVLSAAIFAAAHSYALLPSLAIFLAGIILASVYWWRQTLITPILLHGLLNSFGVMGILIMMQLLAHSGSIGVVTPPEGPCKIDGLVPGAPAHEAGLRVDDVIVRIAPDDTGEAEPADQDERLVPKPTDAAEVRGYTSLLNALSQYIPGDVVVVTVERDGERLDYRMPLVAREDLSREKPIGLDDADDAPTNSP